MNRIALIIPYFGKLPNYFHLWKESCKKNTAIDFILLTDNKIANGGGNFHVHQTTLSALKAQFEQCLGMPVSLASPYKLCDYRPMYGYLMPDLLRGYDFWGHCDLDMIFGDIAHFISDDILARYDRILSRGHLTIYRNTPEVNAHFMQSTQVEGVMDWKEVVASPLNHSYDEWGGKVGTSNIWRALRSDRLYDEIVFDDINYLKKHFLSSQKQLQGTDAGKSHFIFEYDNGTLYRWYWDEASGCPAREQTLYAHFQKRDMQVSITDTTHYLIIPNTFIPYAPVTPQSLRHHGRTHLFYKKYFQIRWKNLKRKLHR